MQLFLTCKASSVRMWQKSLPNKIRAYTKTLYILLMLAPLQGAARDYSQEISLSLTNAPLERFFKLVEQQTNFRFVYSQEAMEQAKPVTIHVKNENLENVLQLAFANQSLTYSFEEKFIVIKVTGKQKEAIPLFQDIRGRVVNENGEPLAGATITAKKSNKITSTDDYGEFLLKEINQDDILVITNVGYYKEEINVGTRKTLLIKLKIAAGSLDETIIIGYGSTTRRVNLGSVSKVSGEEIRQQSVSNPLGALEGRVPGLLVSQTTGLPGSSIQIQIRGQNSLKTNPGSSLFAATSDYPLFMIDGVPFAPQNANINQYLSLGATGNTNQVNRGEGMSPFNSLNPADIESIEILRDADATAIYGSRGANGVVLITTKKGKSGKMRFAMNVSNGLSKVTRAMPLMNTLQYLQMRHEAFYNDSISDPSANIYPTVSNAPDLLIFDTTKYTDWKKYFLGGTANTFDANANISGGNSNTQFLIGAGYRNETYIFPGDFADQKISFISNFHHKSENQNLSIDFSINYTYDKNNSSGSSQSLHAPFLPPNYPDLLNADGSINWKYNGVNLSNNPLSYLKRTYLLQTYNLLGHFQVGYQILPALTLRSSFGYNTFDANELAKIPKASQNPANNPTGRSNFGRNSFQTWIVEPQAEYKKNIYGGKLNLLLGGTFQQSINSLTNTSASGYTNDALLASISGAASSSSGDAYSIYKYTAIFGRLNYLFKNRYILDLTGRRDGSSRFGPGKQFGNFGSVAGGWIFSEETFVTKNLRWVSFGKLKATYGTTGNDNIGNYQYLANWGLSSNTYQGIRGYVPMNLYNPDFSWAVNKKFEAGLELGLLKDKILFNLVWFKNRCANQLISYYLPNQTGFGSVTQNFNALVQNSGWEIQLNSTLIKRNNFNWTSSFNITIPKNKLVSFPGLETSAYASNYLLGKSLNVLRKFNYLGVNDTTGVYEFTTQKGIPTYTPSDGQDYQNIGDLDPKFYGGFRNTLIFKSLQLDIFITFKKQLGLNYIGQIVANTPPGILSGLYGNQPAALLERWRIPGDNVDIEKFTTDFGTPAGQVFRSFFTSSAAYSDASYLRVKTISFSYNLPDNYLKKIKMQALKVYINCQNLFTITRYKGNDPETQNYYGIPPLKTIVLGTQLTF